MGPAGRESCFARLPRSPDTAVPPVPPWLCRATSVCLTLLKHFVVLPTQVAAASVAPSSGGSAAQDGAVVTGVDLAGGEEGATAGGKRKRGRPALNGAAKGSREPVAYLKDAGKCKACDGMHRPHTCGKVGQVRVVSECFGAVRLSCSCSL